jgi:hypothetical protein
MNQGTPRPIPSIGLLRFTNVEEVPMHLLHAQENQSIIFLFSGFDCIVGTTGVLSTENP